MKRRILALSVLTAAWLIALAAVAKNAIDQLEVPPWGNPVRGSVTAPIAGDMRVGQSFVAPLPGLYRIEVDLIDTGAGSGHPVVFRLKSDPGAPDDLYALEFSTTQIEPGTPFAFEFEPIRGSRNRPFFFLLESPQSVPGQAPQARYSPGSTLEGASAYIGGEPAAGNLSFHSYYTLRTRDRVALLLRRMAQDRPGVLGNPAFYALLAGVYVLALCLFLYKVGDQIVKESDGQS